jgi:hypothetical protein
MQTIAPRDELQEVEYPRPTGGETDGETIKGILSALAIMVPIYAVIAWVVMSYWPR